MKILVINGPNLNMLGIREPDIYGHTTLIDAENELIEYGKQRDCIIKCVSSNIEGEIVNFIHSAAEEYDAIIINAGAYSHYSIAILDALSAVPLPAVEVHISNIHTREFFRQVDLIATACVGCISGLGLYGYKAAVDFFVESITE